MYFEMRMYCLYPGKMQEYLATFETIGLPIISRYTTLVGFWYTEVGELNQVTHIWAYESLDDRTQKRAALYEDQAWQKEFLPKIMPLLVKQENKILRAASFSPIK